MPNGASGHQQVAAPVDRRGAGTPHADDYPVREYISAMAQELAGMARWDGDGPLADLLDAAARQADTPPQARSEMTRG